MAISAGAGGAWLVFLGRGLPNGRIETTGHGLALVVGGLFVGWFLQFAIGIAYWLLPRKRTAERPLGYHERGANLAFALLNSGLFTRVIAEPPGRVGNGGDLGSPATGGDHHRRGPDLAPDRAAPPGTDAG